MGQENSSGSQTLCYINAAGQEECFRNEYTSTNDYNMGFDIVAKSNLNRAQMLQNLLESEPDKLRLVGHKWLVSRKQAMESLPEHHCFQVNTPGEHAEFGEWLCRDDLERYWDHQCLLGVCPGDEGHHEDLHKVFMGQCTHLHGTELCPGEHQDIRHLTKHEVGPYSRIFGDVILSSLDIAHAFHNSDCMKVASSFVCLNDIERLFETGCIEVHRDLPSGNHILPICDDQFLHLIQGQPIEVEGQIVQAHFSSQFNDYSQMCRQTALNHFTCWHDVDRLYSHEEECTLYGQDSWVCYEQVQRAWQEGSCVAVENQAVCGDQMLRLALRECIHVNSQKLCPLAFGAKSKHHYALEDHHRYYRDHQEVRHAMPYREEGQTHFHDVYAAPRISEEHYLV